MLLEPILATAFATLASSWSIAFYSGDNCNQDPSFADATYSGTGKSDCLAAGAPGDGCEWHTNNGANSAPCTGPMSPPPGSFYFPAGTNCRIGDDKTCWSNEGLYDGQTDKCFPVADLYRSSDPLYFACYDV